MMREDFQIHLKLIATFFLSLRPFLFISSITLSISGLSGQFLSTVIRGEVSENRISVVGLLHVIFCFLPSIYKIHTYNCVTNVLRLQEWVYRAKIIFSSLSLHIRGSAAQQAKDEISG